MIAYASKSEGLPTKEKAKILYRNQSLPHTPLLIKTRVNSIICRTRTGDGNKPFPHRVNSPISHWEEGRTPAEARSTPH